MAEPLRIEALLVKLESSYGVDPTPGVGDAVRFTGRLWPMLRLRDHFENRRDDVVSGTLIPPKRGIVAGELVEIEIPWEMKGKGSAYAAEGDIEANPLIKACGYSVAVDTTGAAEKLTYSLADTGHASCAMYAYAGGLRYIILGCRGALSWPVTAGANGMLMFRMIGMLAADPTAQAIPSATYDASLPPVAKGMAFTINAGGDYNPDVLEMEFASGEDVQVIEDANGADGLQGIEIPGRDPKFTCTIRKDALTTYDPFALLKAVTQHTKLDWTLGGTQYNRFKLDVTEAYLAQKPELVDYRGFAGYRLAYDVKALTIIAD